MSADAIVNRDGMVPMRDGVRLATDVYRPDDSARHPVVLLRTPYHKLRSSAALLFHPLDAVERGYVCVIQDARGRFKSEGTWTPFLSEAADGYDTVEWAASQPWSDGAVGVYGSSYMGVTCLQAVAAAPPHLKAAIAYMTGSDYHNGWTYTGGAFELGFNLWWTTGLAWDTVTRLPLSQSEREKLVTAMVEASSDPWKPARHLPLAEMDHLKTLAPHWREWHAHPCYDDYWRKVDVNQARITVPVLHFGGWYDMFLRGHLDLQKRLQADPDERQRRAHRFIVGPWDHEAYLGVRASAAGARDFGPAAPNGSALTMPLAFQWFDHWLKGQETGLAETPPVKYFVIGKNTWKAAQSWPPPHTLTAFYLHSHGHANTRSGDGLLSQDEPRKQPPDSYLYDPLDPVPTSGGRTLQPVHSAPGIQDQARVEERDDVLVYTSEHLTSAVSIAGPVSVTLFVASSAPDTDFTAKLVDVEPGGYCAHLAEGIVRARYRNGSADAWLEPGRPAELAIDLWDTAYTFKVGHRIRLEISSSNFPKFDRNLNSKVSPALGTKDDVRRAVQQVRHDPERPSRLVLPVVRE